MTRDKVSQFLLRLIKLTQGGELTWESYAPINVELPNSEIIIDKVYTSILGGRKIKLYKYKYKYYKDEYDFDWLQSVRLELLDENDKADYEFEYQNSMNDLYDIVREQASKVLDLIDDVLGVKLQILSATYYTPKAFVDVTESLTENVKNNKLVIDATNTIKGDPDPGTIKKLRVKYSFSGQTFEKEVSEGQTLIIP